MGTLCSNIKEYVVGAQRKLKFELGIHQQPK